MRRTVNLARSSGFSIVELLIAGVLGLILLAGVVQLFLGSRVTFQTQQQLANVQTDGRFATLFFERIIENAGFFESFSPSFTSGIDFAQSTDGGAGGNDSIAVQLEITAGGTADCNGVAVAGTVLRNRIFVNGTTLLCQGNGGGAAQPIIENVESFQVLYGVDNDADGVPNTYLNAAAVAGGGFAARVVAVKVAVLIATEENAIDFDQAQNFDVLDEVVNTNDRLIRRVFQQTINLPNQAYAAILNTGN